MKVKETALPLPAWIIDAVESGILDWSDVREILSVVAHEERSAFSWWRTMAISLVLALLCWVASRF